MSALDRDAVLWFAHACQLEGENQKLRSMIVELMLWIVDREELVELVHAEVAARWGKP